MTTTKNNEHKKLNFSSEREQSQACLNSAEHEKNQGRKVLNVPNLRFKEFQGEWEKCKLGDYGKVVTGNTPPTKDIENYENGTYLWASPADLGTIKSITETKTMLSAKGFAKTRTLPKGSVLVTCIGSTIGKTGMATKEMSTNQQINSIVVNDNNDNEFVYYAIQSAFPRYLSSIAVQAVPIISKSAFELLPNKKPCLQEQKRIGKFLSLLDERIATQNKIIDKLQSLIKGINQRLFMNNGINYKLGEVCEIRSGYSGNQLLSKKGLKISRIETISGHKVNLERVGYVAPFESSENYKLQVGDILFSNINSVEYIGNTAFIDKDYDLYHGMNLLRLTPNNMVVIPFYLYLLLNTNRMLNRFKTVCNKAVSQASINQTELGKTVVQIPDINAQEQICKLYQALYDKLESEKYANSLFQKQKQYLLRQMFI